MKQEQRELFIVAFCICHMVAIGLYSITDSAPLVAAQLLRRDIRPFITPYIQITSQWQAWNLFSPDPLRRVTEYIVEKRDDHNWATVRTINAHTIPWWKRAYTLKYLRRIEAADKHPILDMFLVNECRNNDIYDADIRLRMRSYVLPSTGSLLSPEWWNIWKPQWTNTSTQPLRCPPRLAS